MNEKNSRKMSADLQAIGLHVVSREIPADLETPVSAFLKLKDYGARILLESVESGTIVGRYSFICLKPKSRIAIGPKDLIIDNGGGRQVFPHNRNVSPLDTLKGILQRMNIVAPQSHPRLLGGAVGHISYDFIRFFEKIPDQTQDDLELPLALFYLVDTLLVFDHLQRRLKVLCLVEKHDEKEAAGKLATIIQLLQAPLRLSPDKNHPPESRQLDSNFTKKEFCDAVDRVKKYIVAGDVYQLVLSQRLQGRTAADPFMIYRALRMLNPSPYMFFLDFDEFKLIGSSPEALVRLEDDQATVRPIAGTRPRGKNDVEDQQLSEQLLNDEKERAEHVMLVDLGRNDLGRCCEFGTVSLTDFMKIERYSHVMHMTSNVVGKLREGLDQFDLFRAAFPAGTVTGAPKIKAMSLIDQLENAKRGPYAGAVGYFSLSGDADWCITIRTIIMKGEEFFLQAGAGIVADSVPENEYQETRNKIAALSKAIELAEGGF